MVKEKLREYLRWGATFFLIILCSIAVFFLFWRFEQILNYLRVLVDVFAPIITGLVIAYLLAPVTQWVGRMLDLIPLKRGRYRARITRGIAILAAVALLLSVISFMIGTLIPQIINAVRVLLFNMDTYLATARRLIEPLLDLDPAVRSSFMGVLLQIEQGITDFLQNDILRFMGTLTTGVLEVGKFVYNFVIGLIVSIYLLAANELLVGRSKKLLYAFVRPDYSDQVLDIARQTNRMFRRFIMGKIVSASIVGVLCFLFMTALRMPYVLLISVIIGVTNVIPYFGPFLGAIPSAFLILLIDPTKCLIFVIFILVLQQVEGNYIEPKVVGNTTGLSSLGVLFSILVGGGLFGLVGLLVSVPICGVLYTLVKRMTDRRLKKRGMPIDTKVYVNVEDSSTLTKPVRQTTVKF